MVKKLSIGLVLALWLAGTVYLALLSNWFRYGFSLEAMAVASTLLPGVLISSVLAFLAYRLNSIALVVSAFIATGVAEVLVVTVQLDALGEMPSLYLNHIEKSPAGRTKTPQGEVEYWIELKNPFADSHSEHVVIRREAKEYRFEVPIFNGTAGGYMSPGTAQDWGQLEVVSAPDVYMLKIGPHLSARGSSFKINLRTGVVETISKRQKLAH